MKDLDLVSASLGAVLVNYLYLTKIIIKHDKCG